MWIDKPVILHNIHTVENPHWKQVLVRGGYVVLRMLPYMVPQSIMLHYTTWYYIVTTLYFMAPC